MSYDHEFNGFLLTVTAFEEDIKFTSKFVQLATLWICSLIVTLLILATRKMKLLQLLLQSIIKMDLILKEKCSLDLES